MPLPTPTRWIACLLALALAACGNEGAGTQGPKGGAAAGEGAAAAKAGEAAKGDKGAKAAPLPKKVTPGDVLPPLPPLPRRVAGGAGPAPKLPMVSCSSMAPDASFKLARRVEVMRRGVEVSTELNVPTHKPAKGADGAEAKPASGTLELCVFHKWRQREPGENRTHTGRVHHFVAAFPGTDVASWTTDELSFKPKTLPKDALWISSGWAAVVPTGLPDRPALAVVSGRFYDGKLGEEVHYTRVARVLRRHRGRWAWVRWQEKSWSTLDPGHIEAVCKKGGPGCAGAKAKARAAEKRAERRLKVREARLAGRAPLKAGKHEGDPQSIWVARAKKILKGGRWKEAIDLALRAEFVCGEPVRASRKVIAKALRMGKVKPETIEPELKKHRLCEPLADKSPPRVRKVAKREE